jgi:hypothetical protein
MSVLYSCHISQTMFLSPRQGSEVWPTASQTCLRQERWAATGPMIVRDAFNLPASTSCGVPRLGSVMWIANTCGPFTAVSVGKGSFPWIEIPHYQIRVADLRIFFSVIQPTTGVRIAAQANITHPLSITGLNPWMARANQEARLPAG